MRYFCWITFPSKKFGWQISKNFKVAYFCNKTAPPAEMQFQGLNLNNNFRFTVSQFPVFQIFVIIQYFFLHPNLLGVVNTDHVVVWWPKSNIAFRR